MSLGNSLVCYQSQLNNVRFALRCKYFKYHWIPASSGIWNHCDCKLTPSLLLAQHCMRPSPIDVDISYPYSSACCLNTARLRATRIDIRHYRQPSCQLSNQTRLRFLRCLLTTTSTPVSLSDIVGIVVDKVHNCKTCPTLSLMHFFNRNIHFFNRNI